MYLLCKTVKLNRTSPLTARIGVPTIQPMPDETSARLWGLRAGCESLLRGVTRAQKCLEDIRGGETDALPKLRQELASLAGDMRTLTRDAEDAISHVAEVSEAPEARRRSSD